jgi:hypothetical protein
MRLSADQSRTIFEKYGCFVCEVCDKCGQILGPVRHTRKGEGGAWCSRECRDGKGAHAPGTCVMCKASLVGLRRGTKFCSDTCRERENRKSQTVQFSRDEQLKTEGL